MPEHEFRLRSKVWRWQASAGWYFVSVGKLPSRRIRAVAGPRRGWGSIPVRVRLGTSTWSTSIFPSRGGIYVLALKAAVRRKESLAAGDTVSFTVWMRGL